MTVAVYAGSFDPITLGHASVVRRAARLFSHVRVLVAVNPDKRALFSESERVALARELLGAMPNVSVDATTGLVVEYARAIGASYLVRGLRGAADAEPETELARVNLALAPELQTLLIPAEPGLSEVSSSGLKELARRGEDLSRLSSASVVAELERRLGGSLG